MLRKTCLNWWLCNVDLSVSDTDYTPWKNIFSAEECLKCGTITHVLRWPQQKVQLKMKLIKNAGRNLKKTRTMMKKDGCLSEFQGSLQSSLCVQQPCAVPSPALALKSLRVSTAPVPGKELLQALKYCKNATPERFHLCNSRSCTKPILWDF